VTGEAWFFGRRFAITRDVLVPRPETELLVERALEFLRKGGPRGGLQSPRRFASQSPVDIGIACCDVGTGSGVLAITLACELPQARAVALDVSAAALEVARGNARALGVAERVRFARSDLFASAGDGAFDCIVANLPYVPSADIARAPDPVAFEPRLALDGGPDGLDVYRRLLAQAPARLAAGGMLLLEAAPPTLPALAALVRAALPHAVVERLVDASGRERAIAATLRAGGEREAATT
jgi:release factor glutamine methyltransferase